MSTSVRFKDVDVGDLIIEYANGLPEEKILNDFDTTIWFVYRKDDEKFYFKSPKDRRLLSAKIIEGNSAWAIRLIKCRQSR